MRDSGAEQIWFSDEDAGRAQRLTRELAALGHTLVEGRPRLASRKVVVLLSAASVADDDFVADLAAIPDSVRIVAVTMGTFDADGLPERLRALNWILWPPVSKSSPAAQVAQALAISESDHIRVQELVARSEGWQASGRDESHLVVKSRWLREAVVALQVSGLTPTEGLIQYVQASGRATRKARNKRIRRGLLRVSLVVALVIASFKTYQTFTFERSRENLWVIVGSQSAVAMSPESQALKLSALLLLESQHGKAPEPVVISSLQQALSYRWTVDRAWTSPSGKAINGIAFTGIGSNQVWADGGGEVWSVEEGHEPVSLAQLGSTPLEEVAVAQEGRVVAASRPQEVVVLVDGTSTSVRNEVVPGDINSVHLSSEGEYLTVVTDEGAERINVQLPASDRKFWTADSIEAIGGAGAEIALGVVGGRATVRDLVSGVSVDVPDEIWGELSTAAIGADGRVVIAGADRQLWTALLPNPLGNAIDWRATGVGVPDLLLSLAVTSHGEAVLGSSNDGTQVVDLQQATSLGKTCILSSPRNLTVSPDGEWLACGMDAIEIVRLADLRPLAWAEPEAGPTLSDTAGGVTATIGPSQRFIDVSGQGFQHRIDGLDLAPLGGVLSAIGVSPDGATILVGGVGGGLAELDLQASGPVQASQWATPDKSTIIGFRWDGDRRTVISTSALWDFQGCRGCGSRPLGLIEETVRRKQSCQPAEITAVIPADIVDQLDIHECRV